MATPAVLALGLDPHFADFSTMPQFTPQLIRSYVESEIAGVRQLGYAVDLHLIAPGEEGEAEVEAALRGKDYACVVIGAGLREAPEQFLLFERILNLVHRGLRRKRAWRSTRPPVIRPKRSGAGSPRARSNRRAFQERHYHAPFTPQRHPDRLQGRRHRRRGGVLGRGVGTEGRS
jgi:hypothetical protein